MPGVEDAWTADRARMHYLVAQASRAFAGAVMANPGMGPEEFTRVYSSVVRMYGAAAVWAAMDTLGGVLDEWGQPQAEPVAPEPPQQAALEGSAGWAVRTSGSAPAAMNKALGSVGRRVRNAHRETVAATAAAHGLGYARVPGPKACAFCLMLASRGAVYQAHTVGARVAGQAFHESQRYHDHCDCQARLVRGEEDLPEINRQLQAEWYAVTRGAPGDVDLAELWRSHVRLTRPDGESVLPGGVDLSVAKERALAALRDAKAGGGMPPKSPKPPTGGFFHAEGGEGVGGFGPSPGARPWPQPLDSEGRKFDVVDMNHWLPDDAIYVEPAAFAQKVKAEKPVSSRSRLLSLGLVRNRFTRIAEVDEVSEKLLQQLGVDANGTDIHRITAEQHQIKQLLRHGATEVIQLGAGRKYGKTPDVLVDGVMVELKTPVEGSARAYSRALREGPAQARVVYVSLYGKHGVDDRRLKKGLAQFAKDYAGRFDRIVVEGPDGRFYYADGGDDG